MSRPLPPVSAALIDVEYLREKVDAHEPLSAEDLQAAVDAALSLAAALERVNQLQTSRIGADEFLAQFSDSPGGFDAYAFYQGVSFALARVARAAAEARVDRPADPAP